jgi:integrase
MAAYRTALHAAGRSPGTVRLHLHYLRHTARYVPNPWEATLAQLTTALGAEPDWKPETRKSCRSSIAAFYRWAVAAGYLERDPAAGLPVVKVPRGVPRPAPDAALDAALRDADARTRLMLLLAARLGLRVSEIARVHSDDLVSGVLFVTGKGGATRPVPVVDVELERAIAGASGYLFPGKIDGHLAPATVTKLLSGALPGRWTGHTLRHRFATRSNAARPDLLALQQVLGHARPETTQRYTLVPLGALRAVVEAAA